MRFLILGRSVGRIEKKKNLKKTLKKPHKKSRNSRLWYPRTALKVNIHIFGLTKCTTYCKKMFMFLFLFFSAVTMLIFQITTSVLFFFLNAKSLGGRTTVNGQKKEDGLHKKGVE